MAKSRTGLPNEFFAEAPGQKISDKQTIFFRTNYLPAKSRITWIYKAFAFDNKRYGDFEEVHNAYGVYRGFLITMEYQDYYALVANHYTSDSIIVVRHTDWGIPNTKMSPSEYLQYCDEKRKYPARAKYISADEQYKLDCVQSMLDYSTYYINLAAPINNDSATTAFFEHNRPKYPRYEYGDELTGGPIKEVSGTYKFAEEYVRTSNYTEEEITFLQERLKAIEDYGLESEFATYALKTSLICGHAYSNELAKCPICGEDNPDCEGLIDYSVNPEWIGTDGNYYPEDSEYSEEDSEESEESEEDSEESED